MPKLIVDPRTRAKLHDLRERLKMCDEGGRVVSVLPDAGHYRDESMNPCFDGCPVGAERTRRRSPIDGNLAGPPQSSMKFDVA